MPALTSGQLDELRPGVRRLVANNSGFLTGPGTNTYLLGRTRFFVIDPGPADQTHIERILQATGGRIDAVLVTHTHSDHSPGAQVLSERLGVPLFGRAVVRGDHAVDHEDETFQPTRVLEDNDELQIEGQPLRALHTPGHASNHLCYLLEGGLLFTGDHLMQGSTVVIAPPDGNMRQYLYSLERLQREPIRALAPGHGLLIEDGLGEVAAVIAHRLKREAKVIEKLQQCGSRATTEQLLPLVYDDVDPRVHRLARHSLLAHLMKLREDGKVSESGSEPQREWRWLGPAG